MRGVPAEKADSCPEMCHRHTPCLEIPEMRVPAAGRPVVAKLLTLVRLCPRPRTSLVFSSGLGGTKSILHRFESIRNIQVYYLVVVWEAQCQYYSGFRSISILNVSC